MTPPSVPIPPLGSRRHLPGPGLGPLPGHAGPRTGRHAVAGAHHQPAAIGGVGGRGQLSGPARPAARGGGGAVPRGASGPEPDGVWRRGRGKVARPASAECQPLSPAAHGPARPAGGGPGAAAAAACRRSTRWKRPRISPQLPALFATSPGDAKELAYLQDALATSLDQLIRDASPDARRLLWMIAVANEPVALGMLNGVWGGENQEQQQLRQLKAMLPILPMLPEELRSQIEPLLTPEFRATCGRPAARAAGRARDRAAAASSGQRWAWSRSSAPGRTMTTPASPATNWSGSGFAPGWRSSRRTGAS